MVHDLRFGWRALLKAPGFTAATVITLALATGATTAIFSIVNSVLLRPLPFADPERLAQVEELQPMGGPGPVLFNDLLEFRKQSRAFESLTAYGLTTRHLTGATGTERLTTVMTDHQFFAVLGTQPLIGRTYGPTDEGSLLVMSERLWTRLFNRDPSILTRTLTLEYNVFNPALKRSVLEQSDFTVLGVMPQRFQFPYGAGSVYAAALPETQTDLWVLNNTQAGRWGVTGRLRPGITIAAAHSELTIIEQGIDAMTPSPYRPTGVRVTALSDEVLGPIRGSLWMLFGAVALVLAAACANVANLMLARVAARMREVVTRAALGAGRMRLARQFLTESLLLSLAGGVFGVAVAWWTTTVLVSIGSAKIPRAHEIALDWRAFVFLLAICLVTALVFGLAPALAATRVDLQTATKESGGQATLAGGYRRLRDALVVAEVALAFVLAFGAVVVISELRRLQQTPTGMETENVFTLHLTPRLPESDYYRIEERVSQIPGVSGAGLIHMVPLQNWGGVGTFQIRGRQVEDASRMPRAELRSITPGYFATLRIPLRAGRALTEADSQRDPRPILINEALAQAYFPGEDPLGRELDRGTIVGIVADVRQIGLDQSAYPQIYSAVDRTAGIAADIGMSLLVRADDSAAGLIDAVRSAVRHVNPNVAIFNVRTMKQIVADSLWELNLYRWLIGLFAGLALLLCAIGLYGVISYGVVSRSKEFAIRLALGSDQTGVARLVLQRGLWLTGGGLLIGIAGVLALIASLGHLPIAVSGEPAILAGVATLLLAIALIACALPALRVARVNPVAALRQE